MAKLVFMDTSYVIALQNSTDPYHAKAKALDSRLLSENALLVLHHGVLLEIGDGFARLTRRAKGVDLIQRICSESGYSIFPIKDDVFQRALQLYSTRPDKEWGLTDCVSFELMRREGIQDALTADRHFSQAGCHTLLLDP